MTALPDHAGALASAADHQLAAELAEQAAALLRALRASGIDDPDVLRAEGDRRSHELLVTKLAARRPAELVPMGSAGFKALAVVRGTAEIYAHSGGQYEWDSAAPVAVALAHAMHASRLDGTPLAYNNADPYLPDLLIAHPDWARLALQAVAGGDQSAGIRPAQGT
jgi:fructose-1,6-bisphosphatase/inositol monophosphatase family enzyme